MNEKLRKYLEAEKVYFQGLGYNLEVEEVLDDEISYKTFSDTKFSETEHIIYYNKNDGFYYGQYKSIRKDSIWTKPYRLEI